MNSILGLKELKRKIKTEFKCHRKYLGLTQQQVADIFGLQRTSITNMESGNQTISAHEYLYFMSLTKSEVTTEKS
jgi:DNA-binding XRE family transcriptional regulator